MKQLMVHNSIQLKATRIIQQWRIVDAIFSIRMKVKCLGGSFEFAKKKKKKKKKIKKKGQSKNRLKQFV